MYIIKNALGKWLIICTYNALVVYTLLLKVSRSKLPFSWLVLAKLAKKTRMFLILQLIILFCV